MGQAPEVWLCIDKATYAELQTSHSSRVPSHGCEAALVSTLGHTPSFALLRLVPPLHYPTSIFAKGNQGNGRGIGRFLGLEAFRRSQSSDAQASPGHAAESPLFTSIIPFVRIPSLVRLRSVVPWPQLLLCLKSTLKNCPEILRSSAMNLRIRTIKTKV